MFKKETLFDVVQSLNQKEVRNFYRSLNTKESNDKNYLILFELVRKQKKADDKELMESLVKKTGAQNFAKTKEYLLELVFKSLEINRSIYDDYYEILDRLYLAEIFYRKGILHVAEEILIKTKKLINDTEYFDQTDRVFNTLAKLYRKASQKREEAQRHLDDFALATKKIENIRKYRILEVNFYFLTKQIDTNKSLEKLNEIIKHPLLQSEEYAITLSTKIIYHNIYRIYYSIIDDHQKLFFHSQSIVDIYIANPIFKGYHPKHFLRSLANLGEASLLINQDDLFIEVTNIFKKHEAKILNSPIPVLVFKYHAEFLKLRKEAKYAEGLKLIQEFNDTLERNGIKMFEELELSLIINILIFAFANREFKRMIKYLNRMGALVEKQEFAKYFILHKIIELLKSYEQKDFELCDSQIRAINRNLQTRTTSKDIEIVFQVLCRVIKEKAMAIPNLETIEKEFIKLNEELWKVKQYSELEDFPFRNWSYAKAKNISMLELKEHTFEPIII